MFPCNVTFVVPSYYWQYDVKKHGKLPFCTTEGGPPSYLCSLYMKGLTYYRRICTHFLDCQLPFIFYSNYTIDIRQTRAQFILQRLKHLIKSTYCTMSSLASNPKQCFNLSTVQRSKESAMMKLVNCETLQWLY